MKKAVLRPKSARLVPADPSSARARIIYAAFGAFLERGFSNVSMLEIATRARVSKRDLYAEFESKSALLNYCITHRAQRIKLPADLPDKISRGTFAQLLTEFGLDVLKEMALPEVQAAYRLAIAESWSAPEIAATINRLGRETALAALIDLMKRAQSNALLDATEPRELADQYMALACRDLLVQLLLGVVKAPPASALQQKAEAATAAFLALHASGR
jgi:AcrR family transcriptional regulator